MKITIEFDSLEEMDSFRGATPAAVAAPAEKPAPKTRAKRRTKKEIEAERAAAEAAETTEPEVAPPATATEPPPPAPPSEPEPEPLSAMDPAPDDVEVVRGRFKDLVGDDYETALGIVEQLGCGTFDEVIAQGKIADLVEKMDAVAGAAA